MWHGTGPTGATRSACNIEQLFLSLGSTTPVSIAHRCLGWRVAGGVLLLVFNLWCRVQRFFFFGRWTVCWSCGTVLVWCHDAVCRGASFHGSAAFLSFHLVCAYMACVLDMYCMSTCALLNEIFMLVPLIPSACVLRLYILVISSSVAASGSWNYKSLDLSW